MTEWRVLVAPYLESIRRERTTPETIRVYTKRLIESIEFLEQGGFTAQTEEYYKALEENLIAGGLAASTVKGRISLAQKFFAWAARQEGDRQIPMNEITQESNEEASVTQEHHEEDVMVQEGEQTPLFSSVEAKAQPAPSHPQEEEAGGKQKNTGKPQKLTVYPDTELDADIKDLARIDGLPVSTFILNLIKQEVQGRKEDLETLRRLRAKRA